MIAFLMDDDENKEIIYKNNLKGLDITAVPLIKANKIVPPFVAVFWLRKNEFLIVGTKMKVKFSSQTKKIQIVDAEFGGFEDNEWLGHNAVEFTESNGAIEYDLPLEDLKIEQVRFRIK